MVSSATLYHAITGRIPPSAIERILNDTYEPLSELQPQGFPPALLAGIDAGLAFRAADRPQSIAEWKQVLRPGSTALEATRIARKPGPLARAARNARRAGTSIKVPVVSAGVAAALVLLAGGGYLAFRANVPAAGSSATLDLSTEQLEQVLAERRKADALVVEKRRLEEEARQKAEMDAEAKRQADAELEQARQALQRSEQELATLKTDIEARRQPASGQVDQAAATQRAEEEAAAQRKAEAEAAALRDLEEEAAKKAEAEAEAKRQTDQALAVAEAQRKQAEAEALAKAEAEVAARRQASQEAQRKAEAEAASRRQADEAQAKAQAEREKVEAEAKIKADAKAEADKAAAALARLKEEGETAEKDLAPRTAGPSAPPGRADLTGLRHAGQRRHLRPALARDDRGLAEGAQPASHRLLERRAAPGPAQGSRARARQVRRGRTEEDRGAGRARGSGEARAERFRPDIG